MQWITSLEGGPRRVNHAAVSVGHLIFSFGGYCTGENSSKFTAMDVHVLNTATLRWTKHPCSNLPYFENDDISPFKRYGHTAVVYKDSIYVWGGRNDASSCSVLFKFDPVYYSWTAPPIAGDVPSARDGHTACVWNNRMYIFGGCEEDNDSYARISYYLDLDTFTWHFLPNRGTEPSVRDFHSAVCLNDKMYIFGGRGTLEAPSLYGSPTNEIYCNQLWYFDLRRHTWVKPITEGVTPTGRRSHSAFVHNNKMYIFGGYNAILGHHLNDLHEFDPATNRWRELRSLGTPPRPRRRQACVMVEDRLFLFGGTSFVMGDKLIDHSDMHVLDMKPTLKTLCLCVVKKFSLDTSLLPQQIRALYKNTFTDNVITLDTRLNNSAG